jgi:P-type Ca2+ transporter type 2C
MKDWHNLTAAEVLQKLNSNPATGLDGAEVGRRQEKYGANELSEENLKSPWLMIRDQLSETMVVILILAAIISALMGDSKDAIAILAIVVLNTILGFSQEYRAEKAMAALKKLTVPTVRVRRDGFAQEVSARELVPGDLLLLEAGNLVPADCRLLESYNLRAQEAALTGESAAVEKIATALDEMNLSVADRCNMVYMGTVATYGRGLAVVTEIGMNTELGAIARMIETVHRTPTPLQRRTTQLGKTLAAIAIVIVAVVFLIGWWRGEELKLLLLTAISMAVAAVPEGLPAVVTIALALGAQRMLKRQSLIRKLPAVETLGSITVICSDKTGTLTQNRMTVKALSMAGQHLDLSEQPLNIQSQAEPLPAASPVPAMSLLLIGGALCNDASLTSGDEEANHSHSLGDPTEIALLAAAARFGLQKSELESRFARVAELPFDAERKRMTTIHRLAAVESGVPLLAKTAVIPGSRNANLATTSHILFTKGAVDSLLTICSRVQLAGGPAGLDEAWRKNLLGTNQSLAGEGMRVLGVAFRLLDSLPTELRQEELERDLVFLGMAGISDPPRPEARSAVELCKAAGIRPVMITGDHPGTAQQIARELGIVADESFLTGNDIDRLSGAELEEAVTRTAVFARVSPAHKLKIVEALQNRGQIVAMTGDGVNDAPALKKADIGVAMSISGTDVAKEAADMVLVDDNFATIVAAIEEGRVIYDNIRKFLKYLITSNFAEIWVMFLGPLLGSPTPLLPLQILWINLVTDGLPGLALGVEPAERHTMHRPPYPPDEHIFSRHLGRHVLLIGLLMGMVSLATGYWYWSHGEASWQTMIFTILTLSQMGHVLAIRSERDSLFKQGILSNKPLLQAVGLTFLLQMAVIYHPYLQSLFKTTALSLKDLLLCLILSSVVFWCVELEKWLQRRHPA